MRRWILLFALLLTGIAPLQAADNYRELNWDELVPKGWDPAADLKAMNLGQLKDSDPRAMEALDKLRQMWNNAPTDKALQGAKIRLPGFAIPLEKKGDKVTEFLLVPYFGACIHTPPPPANQIIHVISRKPVANLHSMDSVWVNGTMSLHRADTPWGAAGYRITAERIDAYMPAPPPDKANKR